MRDVLEFAFGMLCGGVIIVCIVAIIVMIIDTIKEW
jgi:hypothetical protein